ncbi:uncharacterized protein LOC132897202 isoform X2 [Neoarius graeffei]|uniref:uncharacterized protein LOC132897202 isoform X2 n=1 Tax=Neoarius graeffei TaxID=443677 RepID=UPI00298CF608|nr:uncharacterized protein LOC132897202 isoform X2 [Neoarius graeffei]XP_060794631.1 uncharacterized protein LOC132897202 isoform X2 [Neoarius graeffei]XP_060794632.1 uncharacterized protein LOC132897202 isoform X2 [Neoarius graeffei]XP_060794633.1 uncharacterized protein LOC132897202 isoform X2 [Neoarius graeffei]XP_060794634.1 uncharacterized protein LOC132897202 isoform X2 [Neoarius graeffei]XP_060794635.1 uncharacterized protein LOC132897202 isoform X2 [Neoarius graeffei]XP_060794636.1 un
MIFSLRQVQEKCTEQNMPMYAVFIDFTKAFDTVSREALWTVFQKYGCTDKIINLLKSFHDRTQVQVAQERNTSEKFEVTNGVKQGCILAPLRFSLYLAAMLEVAFDGIQEGIYIQTRQNADLFKVSQFKAQTLSTKNLVREMFFADDSAIVTHSFEGMQYLIDKFARAAIQFSLKINIKKTECLYQPVKLINPEPDTITVSNKPLASCSDFKYLGSTISSNNKINKEILNRMGNTSTAFSKLQNHLWNNKHVSTKAKCKVYRAIVLSTLLYGAETWTIYCHQVKKLHAFMMQHLRAIMGVTWKDKITNVDILNRADLPSMVDILIEKGLRWLGHVHRMGNERLPRQLLYSQLCEGMRNHGQPKLRFKDAMKSNMKWQNIDSRSWQQVAENKPVWRKNIKPP